MNVEGSRLEGDMGQTGAAPRHRRASAGSDPETTVEFSIDVAVPVDRAFRVFTEGLDRWWPRTHHIGTAEMAVAILEPRVGGRWYELGVDGSTCDWGVVLAWDPPRHVAMSWHLDGDFHREETTPSRASRVDVRFESIEGGATRVTLTHSGLDAHASTWRVLRERIGRGWPTLLGLFAEVATK